MREPSAAISMFDSAAPKPVYWYEADLRVCGLSPNERAGEEAKELHL